MFTRPVGVTQKIYTPQGGIDSIPVQPDRWKYFCDKGAADFIAGLIGKIPGVDASSVQVALDAEAGFEYDVANPGNGVNMYNITAVYAPNGTAEGAPTFPISENAGWLFDRQTKPLTMIDVDRNPGGDSSVVGGPNLHLDLLSGVAQCRWGK